jgi:hypothetical protein
VVNYKRRVDSLSVDVLLKDSQQGELWKLRFRGIFFSF